MNSRRKMYSVLRGPYSEDGIVEYVRELVGGRGRTTSFKGDFPTVGDVKPWDGKDGEVSDLLTSVTADTYPSHFFVHRFQSKRTLTFQTLTWIVIKMNFDFSDVYALLQ